MSATSGIAARVRSSQVPYLLRWSDPQKKLTIEILTEVLTESLQAPAGAFLQGMFAGQASRTWTVLFSSPLGTASGVDASDLSGKGSGAIGIVVEESQSESAKAALSGDNTQCPAPLFVIVRGPVATVSLLDFASREIQPLFEFPASVKQLAAAKFRPFEPVFMQASTPGAELSRSEESAVVVQKVPEITVRQSSTHGDSAPRSGPRLGRWAGSAAVLIIAAAGSWYVWKTGNAQSGPPVSKAESQPAGFGIQVAKLDNNLQIRWDRSLPAVQAAVSAVLKITDGEQRMAMGLSRSDLAAGELLYLPRSTNLKLELAIETPSGLLTDVAHVILPPGEAAVVQQIPPAKPKAREPEPQPAVSGNTEPATDTVVRQRSVTGAPPSSVPAVQEPAPPAASPVSTAGASATPASTAPASAAPVSMAPAPERTPASVAQLDLPRRATPLPSVSIEPLQQPVSPQPTPPAAIPERTPTPEVVRSVIHAPVPSRQVSPIVPNVLQQTLFSRTVIEVTASVDIKGNVVSATTGPYTGVAGHLAQLAKDAARAWKFQPARRDNVPVPSMFVIRFTFDRKR